MCKVGKVVREIKAVFDHFTVVRSNLMIVALLCFELGTLGQFFLFGSTACVRNLLFQAVSPTTKRDKTRKYFSVGSYNTAT